jgi:hypothetical protein
MTIQQDVADEPGPSSPSSTPKTMCVRTCTPPPPIALPPAKITNPNSYALLAEIDDLLTDFLVDSILLDFQTHKMNPDYYSNGKSTNSHICHGHPPSTLLRSVSTPFEKSEMINRIISRIRDLNSKLVTVDELTDELFNFFLPLTP